MKGFGPFLTGAIVGGAAVFASLSYHFVHTKQGLETIPKLTPTFSETYVDVRAFDAGDWAQRRALTAAITKAGKLEQIVGKSAVDAQSSPAPATPFEQVSRIPGGGQIR